MRKCGRVVVSARVPLSSSRPCPPDADFSCSDVVILDTTGLNVHVLRVNSLGEWAATVATVHLPVGSASTMCHVSHSYLLVIRNQGTSLF